MKTKYLALLTALLSATSALADEAGTVALVTGKVAVRHGELILAEPTSVQFHDNFQKALVPNDKLSAGDVIMTGENSYIKIYYRDKTVMDVGPDTTFKIVRFEGTGPHRTISFQVLSGKIRSLVTQSLDAQSSFQIATPATATSAHGTEFVVTAYRENQQPKTDVTCLDGSVTVDTPQPVTVSAGDRFSGNSKSHTVAHFNREQAEQLAVIVPNGIAAAPAATALPGTGSVVESGPAHRALASQNADRQALNKAPVTTVTQVGFEKTQALTEPDAVPPPPPSAQARTEVRK